MSRSCRAKQRAFTQRGECSSIAIKTSPGRPEEVPEDLEGFMAERISKSALGVLSVRLGHAPAVRALPDHHRYPFDASSSPRPSSKGCPS